MTLAGGTAWMPYCGAAPQPGEWLARWNLDPLLLAGLAAFYFLLRSGASSTRDRKLGVLAIGLLLLLFVSPFCALTSALFAARVAHHVLLAALVAPLIAFALSSSKPSVPGSLTLWTAIQAVTFWLWHAPPAYAVALSSDLVYWVMQISITGTAVGFWMSLRRSAPVSAVAALLVTMVLMGLLGALITFAGSPLYAPHLGTTLPWGLSQLEDQQLAGLIMWAPGAALYLAAALFIAHRQLSIQASRTAP